MINNILISLMTFSLFFSYAFDNRIISILIILVILFNIARTRVHRFYKVNVPIMLCLISLIISSFYSVSLSSIITYILLFMSGTLMMIMLANDKKWINTFLKCTSVFGGVHVFSTIIQYLNPQLINKINIILLSPEQLRANTYMLKHGWYAGITGQVGANSFYIILFLITTLCLILFSKKHRKINILLLVFGLIALLMTAKLGPIISFLIASLTITYLFLFYRSKQKNNYKMLAIIVATIVLLIIIYFISITDETFFSISNFNIILTGRATLYRDMIRLINNHFLFGTGLLSVPSLVGNYGHNIYLQILCEQGIIGLILFLIMFIANLKNSLKLYIYYLKNNINPISVAVSGAFNIFFLIYGFSGNPIYDGFSLIFFMIYLAIINSNVIKMEEI